MRRLPSQPSGFHTGLSALIALACLVLVAPTTVASQEKAGGADEDERQVIVLRDGPNAAVLAHGPHALGAFLGVHLIELTPELRRHFGVGDDAGVLVGRVVDDSPAAAAGVAVGDILTAVAGEPVSSPHVLAREIRRREAGEVVDLELWRDGSRQVVQATLAEGRRSWVDIRQFRRPGRGLEALPLPAIAVENLIELDSEELNRAIERLNQELESPEWKARLERFRDHQRGLMDRLEALESRLKELERRLEQLPPEGS